MFVLVTSDRATAAVSLRGNDECADEDRDLTGHEDEIGQVETEVQTAGLVVEIKVTCGENKIVKMCSMQRM